MTVYIERERERLYIMLYVTYLIEFEGLYVYIYVYTMLYVTSVIEIDRIQMTVIYGET